MTFLPAVSATRFRDGMASLAAGISIVTTNGPAGHAGFTASGICSVTDQPPTLLVCMNRGVSSYPEFIGNGHLAVNVLAAGQHDLSNRFADKNLSRTERFASTHWQPMANGCLRLTDSLVSFGCRVSLTQDVGTHCVFYCVVEEIIRNEAPRDALVWFARRYHSTTVG